jgi:Flp pilus assembly pilin Flp
MSRRGGSSWIDWALIVGVIAVTIIGAITLLLGPGPTP